LENLELSGDQRSGASYFDRLRQMRIDWVVMDRLKAGDEETLVELIHRNLSSFEEAGTVIASIQRRLKHFFATYNRDDSFYLVVRNSRTGSIIGGVGIGPLAGLPVSEGVAEIRELVIDAPFRGKGIGRRLLRGILEAADNIGYKRAYLETTPQMENAQRLFSSFGFRPVEQKNALGTPDEKLPSYFLLEDISNTVRQLPNNIDSMSRPGGARR
jgi:N-acetylglutamate synthase-like GNAT family acetyltransferase